MAGNPWRGRLLTLLGGGLITVAEASRMAGVSSARICQWCAEAGIAPAAAREQRLATYYARELLAMAKRGDVLPPMLVAARKRSKGKAPSKPELRASTDDKVIDFLSRGGKIKKLAPQKPKSRL